jgi:hypothetical protein
MAKAAGQAGGKMVRKGDLPQKICSACLRPFAWRKKWRLNWDEVRYCSEACRKAPRSQVTTDTDPVNH